MLSRGRQGAVDATELEVGRFGAAFVFGMVIHVTIFFAYLMPFGSPPIVAAAICATVILWQVYKHKAINKDLAALFLLWFALVLWAVLYRVVLTGDFDASYRVANYYLSGFLLVLAIAHLVQVDEARLMSLLQGLIVVAVIGVVISFANYYAAFFLGIDFLVDLKREGTLAQFHRSRMMGTVGNPNNFAVIVLIPYAVVLAFLTERIKWRTSIVFILMAAALVFASSRGVIFGAAVLCMMALWASRLHSNLFSLAALLMAPLVLSLFALALGSEAARIDQLLDRIRGAEGMASVDVRFEVWRQYLTVFAEQPRILLLGNGINNYLVDHPPENAYIKLVNEFGLPLTLAILVVIAKLTWELGKGWKESVFSRMGLFLVVSLMAANVSNEFIDGRSFWLGLGIAYSCLLLDRARGGALASARRAG